MLNYQRKEVSILSSRLDEPPTRLIVVSGPRQTGKTTLVRQAINQSNVESRYIAVDEPESTKPTFAHEIDGDVFIKNSTRDTGWLVRVWENARNEAHELKERNKKTDDPKRKFVLVFDEIQKIPQWSETVKGLWDADRASECPLHVVILGSAPLLMQQGLTESLAGRFEMIPVNHWAFLEMADAFDLDLPSYIYFGGYPGSAPFINEQPRWRDYIRSSLIEPNIEKDILSMTRIKKPALLKQAFELGCSYSGQILSYNKMVGDLQDAGNTTTLTHYVNLLSNAGLLAGLSKFSGRQHLSKASSPKFNVLNTALMTANSGYSFEEAQLDRTFWGRLVESAVGAHLLNTSASDIQVYYWREKHHEVDFVLRSGQRTVSIEVKSSARHDSSKGLSVFSQRFSPVRSLLIGAQGISLEDFFAHPAIHWFDSS